MQFAEYLKTDLTSWEIGPYDGALPGTMRVLLQLDGEMIVSAEVETGYMHRGLEKSFESHLWNAAIMLADRIDPEAAVFGEFAVCLAVEELAAIEVPNRARFIRVILSELSRISAHLVCIARVAKAVGSETMVHFALRDREKVLDLFELVSGSRFSPNFLRFGGVKADVTDGFIERVLEVCELFQIRLKEYNDLFTYNHAFINRTHGIGVLTYEKAKEYGASGPNARASGLLIDIRKEYPYSGFEQFDFEIPSGRIDNQNKVSDRVKELGDSNDRFLMRLKEISASVEILKQATEAIPVGEFLNPEIDLNFIVPAGEAYARVESSRGLMGCHVVSHGEPKPNRVQFRTPSSFHVKLIPVLFQGIRIEDLPVVLSSLDLSLAEADR